MKKAIITVGLGFGDEGKGATVDYLVRREHADLVVRYCGGSQAGHNVELPNGRRHCFSQFGAGSFAGASTYLGPQVIVELRAMAREASALAEAGLDPFSLLAVHPSCLISTIYHRAINRLRELGRGSDRHGSCGHGIGETKRYWLEHGEEAIFVRDLHDSARLLDKLHLLRERMLIVSQEIETDTTRWPSQDQILRTMFPPATEELAQLLMVGRRLKTMHAPRSYRTAIFEGAQGMLLDEWHGFHPHTTWCTVTPQAALDIAQEAGCGNVTILGITRTYATRHGAGPFPTEDKFLALADNGNSYNEWQGPQRQGHLDLVLLRYAAARAGRIDGLVLNCLDQLTGKLCVSYGRSVGLGPATPYRLASQQALGRAVHKATPTYQTVSQSELMMALERAIAPIVITADGPTYEHRSTL